MDVCESEQALRKHRTRETPRRPLVPAEKNNAIPTRRSGTREVSSRYKSPTPAAASGPQRCPSPSGTHRCPSPSGPRRCPSPSSFTRTTAASKLLPKRALSAERKRPTTPTSPPSPSTPAQDDVHLSRRAASSRMQESLWPSTMRSLSVSFQSDTISIPVSKKERPVTSASDRTLRPTSNVAHKQVETPNTRKPTPERRRSPLKGKNASDQSENSKPVDGLHSRLIDQHRWPSRIGSGVSSLRRFSLPGDASRPLQKTSTDVARLLSLVENGRIGFEVKAFDDSFQVLRPLKSVPATTSGKTGLAFAGVRSQSLATPGSRPASPSRTTSLSSSSSRGISPSRSRPATPPGGVSPSRIRATNSSNQSNNSISVLSFIADFKKGKKGAAYVEDAHQLRLMYNRYLQWRFANARAEDAFYVKNAIVEKTLYNVWSTTLSMWESITRKRIYLQQLQLELKLNFILNDQMAYLDDWAALENNHVDALSGAVEDLEANTLRLPLTGGAKADIEPLKVAICSAVDVMQAMGSAIRPLFSRVEGMNNLISEVAIASAQEKAMLDECEALLAFSTSMQVEEYSLRTDLMQFKQALEVKK